MIASLSKNQRLPNLVLRFLLRILGRAHFIRFGIRDRIIRFFHSPELDLDREFIIPFYTHQYRGKFNTFIDWSVYYYGSYCTEELKLIRDITNVMKGKTFLDIGANVGHHTLFAAGLYRSVIAVEPFEKVYRKIEEKIKDNRLMHVKLLPYAFGEKEETGIYFPPDSTNTGTGSFVTSESETKIVELKVMPADEALRKENINSVNMIKIDAEGFEPQILKGMRETLERNRPIVFFEWSQSNRESSVGLNETNLFPRNYSFFQFYHNQPILFFFQKTGYHLRKLENSWEDGMILAIPAEMENMKNFTHP